MTTREALEVLADALATPGITDERRTELTLYPPRRDVLATPLHPPVQTSTPKPSGGSGVGTSEAVGGLRGYNQE